MESSNSNISINSTNVTNEFVKGVILIVAFLAMIAPFAIKFYKYF